MNWQLFSTVGYISVGLLLLVPVLWVLHMWIRPRRWLVHIALAVGVIAFTLAKVNSSTHVSRIRVDHSSEVEGQMSRQALARKAAEEERAGEVADIRFAEDASGEFLDIAGLDDSDRSYFESFGEDEEPEWKKQKRERTGGGEAEDLESMIGASEQREGVEVAEEFEEQPEADPILMSDADKTMADRLDAANLKAGRWMLLLAVVFVLLDYVRRLNVYREAYFPLPVPSAWADGLTPREPVATRPDKPRRSVLDELRHIARRGETFLYLTDNDATAAQAATPMPRLPVGPLNANVIALADEPTMEDDFVFETLWFGRNSFVTDNPDRAIALLERTIELLADRRGSRARTRKTVHVVWDSAAPVPDSILKPFERLAPATGFTLLICNPASASEHDA